MVKKNIVRQWVFKEKESIATIFIIIACYIVLLSAIIFISKGRNVGHLFLVLIIDIGLFYFFTVSSFAIHHSNVGRQLAVYGDLKEIIVKINSQAANPLYTNGSEGITEEFIFSYQKLNSLKKEPINKKRKKIYIIPIQDLINVEIEQNVYFDDITEIILETRFEEYYQITVHKTLLDTQALVAELQQKILSAKSIYSTRYVDKEKNQDKKRIKHLPEFTKRKIFFVLYIVVFVFFIYLASLGYCFYQAWVSGFKLQEENTFTIVSVFVLMFLQMLCPVIFIYVACKWQRKIEDTYYLLSYEEQKLLDTQLECTDFSLGTVYFGTTVYLIRDNCHLYFPSLLYLKDVIWCYQRIELIQYSSTVSGSLEKRYTIVCTKDKKRHIISAAYIEDFMDKIPNALYGYTKEREKLWKKGQL